MKQNDDNDVEPSTEKSSLAKPTKPSKISNSETVVDLSSEEFVTPDRPTRRSTREKTKLSTEGDNNKSKEGTIPVRKSSSVGSNKQVDDSPVHSTPGVCMCGDELS